MNLKLIAAIVLLVLVVAGLWLSYQAGQNQNELQCQTTLGDLSAQSEKYRKQSEDKIHDLETDRIAQNQDEAARVSALQKRLDVALKSKPGVPVPAGVGDRRIADDAVRVLAETATDPRLSIPDDPSGFVGAEETVTADTVAAYSFYTIEQYNQCASDMNSLQRMVR